jgi:adenine specific DNA methylase Mod
MKLVVTEDDKIIGKYFYDNIKKELDIKGTLINNKFTLNGYEDGIIIEKFTGIVKDTIFEGDWFKATDNYRFPFTMKPVQLNIYESKLLD